MTDFRAWLAAEIETLKERVGQADIARDSFLQGHWGGRLQALQEAQEKLNAEIEQ